MGLTAGLSQRLVRVILREVREEALRTPRGRLEVKTDFSQSTRTKAKKAQRQSFSRSRTGRTVLALPPFLLSLDGRRLLVPLSLIHI